MNIATRWAGAREVERKPKTHTPANTFDYLLREPRHTRCWRRRTWIIACVVAFVALASLAGAIGG